MIVTKLTAPSHETVLRVSDPDIDLLGFIAIHSTQLGPAAGGLRMRLYRDETAALEDVLRLSRGMSFKNAAVGLPLGGGKAVIIGDPATKTRDQLRAFGAAIDQLSGRYWTAEDMGMSPDDMAILRESTGYVAGLETGQFASGDPSPITARGIFQSIRRTAFYRFGSADLTGRRVAIQGLGHVGWALAMLLRAAGASLIVADRDQRRAAQVAMSLGAEVCAPKAILRAQADVLAPCAIGGILDAATIADLQVGAVCGGANNQLATPEDGARLAARGILYAPDYVVNGGGIINVATEILRISERAAFVEEKLTELNVSLDAILSQATRQGRSPADVADELIAPRLQPATAA